MRELNTCEIQEISGGLVEVALAAGGILGPLLLPEFYHAVGYGVGCVTAVAMGYGPADILALGQIVGFFTPSAVFTSTLTGAAFYGALQTLTPTPDLSNA